MAWRACDADFIVNDICLIHRLKTNRTQTQPCKKNNIVHSKSNIETSLDCNIPFSNINRKFAQIAAR